MKRAQFLAASRRKQYVRTDRPRRPGTSRRRTDRLLRVPASLRTGLRAASGALVGLAFLGGLAAGCGIRSTSVPVDAGAAPSRVGCVLPGDGETAGRGGKGNLPVRVYLACGNRVSPVERHVALPDGDDSEKLPVARGLLDALQAEPDSEEESAGFRTAVPRDLKVEGPAEGDPPGALRLSSPLEELPSFALAQIVCTYADTAASGSDRSVILGGPARGGGDGQRLRRYECGPALRTSPEAAETAGTPA
ncbi:hypothetical protein GCM10012287_36150 [Streptomyces daqingensis]|uniref:Lipoprotein n=1 Tax=Streptomyces daqingensis TaxID=1472640 RepID=A0ABQ2MIA3_9ACTN|nr:hypothetical protein [Streptomyces daqingensis]GGO52251.1 hypothetical protein GCM10012287_36150 [Streptomyces daqingensis]